MRRIAESVTGSGAAGSEAVAGEEEVTVTSGEDISCVI
jgi:hypothetical protein